MENAEIKDLYVSLIYHISLILIIILGPQRLIDFTDFFPMGDSVGLILYILFEKYQVINLNHAISKKND